MPNIVRADAVKIAEKIAHHQPQKGRPKFEIKTKNGRKHLIVMIWYGGQWIGKYGITNDQRAHRNHGWVADQIHLSPKQAAEFIECTLGHDAYARILADKSIITEPDGTKANQ
jgi:hypothetical protein